MKVKTLGGLMQPTLPHVEVHPVDDAVVVTAAILVGSRQREIKLSPVAAPPRRVGMRDAELVERILHLAAADVIAERPDGSDEDVHFPQALARAVIDSYSSPGETVLDPFAGWGTTLVVAEKLGRSAVGVELIPERVAAIKRRVSPSAVVLEADARNLDSLRLGQIDLCFTSPPYMSAVAHPQNPLTAYSTLDGQYDTYLAELTEVFLAVSRHLRTGGHLVINAANIRTGEVVTPLAWDIAHALTSHLAFRGETYLAWDQPSPIFTGDYCLAFQKP